MLLVHSAACHSKQPEPPSLPLAYLWPRVTDMLKLVVYRPNYPSILPMALALPLGPLRAGLLHSRGRSAHSCQHQKFYSHFGRANSSYDIPDQAYIQFKDGANPVFNFGAVGIVGLGFTGLSHIDSAVTANGNGTWGRSLLYNIFALNPTEPNFIAMALERANDPSDTVQGSLGVGELAPEYADVSSTEHIPLFPPEGSNRWTILLDSYVVNGATQNLTSTISDVPQGRTVVLVDSGTTYSYVPPDVAQAVYSTVPGAVLNTTTNMWSVPCSGGIRLTLWFACVASNSISSCD
jgi:hypothetical protein